MKSQKVRAKLENKLLELPGVTGVSHKNDDEVVLYVEDEDSIPYLPRSLDSVPVKTIVTGKIVAMASRTIKHRPAFGGISCGNPNITAGTLALIDNNGKLLSNAHVIALGCNGFCNIGTDVWQPGRVDLGSPEDKIGTLSDYVDIKFNDANAYNYADTAVANIDSDRMAEKMKVLGPDDERLIEVGTSLSPIVGEFFAGSNVYGIANKIKYAEKAFNLDIGNTAEAKEGDIVTKSGRTSGWTENEVIDTHATINVQYGDGLFAVFRDQIVIKQPFGTHGDSGSLVFKISPVSMGLPVVALAIGGALVFGSIIYDSVIS